MSFFQKISTIRNIAVWWGLGFILIMIGWLIDRLTPGYDPYSLDALTAGDYFIIIGVGVAIIFSIVRMVAKTPKAEHQAKSVSGQTSAGVVSGWLDRLANDTWSVIMLTCMVPLWLIFSHNDSVYLEAIAGVLIILSAGVVLWKIFFTGK